MAPEHASLPKRKPKESQYLFDLGIRGRKTGLTLPDTGIRDEDGLEPMDHLFSSPEKPKQKPLNPINSNGKNTNGTITSEEDMDVGDSTIPNPAEVIAERKRASGVRLPPPRSKSPIKTFLKSPARRNPSMGPGSSPSRGSMMAPRAASTSAPVRRRLDFSNASFDDNENASASYTAPQKRGGSAMPSLSTAHLMRGERLQPPAEIANSEQSDSMHDETPLLGDEDSFQLVDMGGDEDLQIPDQESEDEPREESEQSPELLEEVMSTNKRRVEAKAAEVKHPAGKRGRPKKQNPPLVAEEEEEEEEEEVVVEEVEEEVEEEREEDEEEQLTSPVAEVTELAKKRGRPKKTAPGPASPEIQIPAKKQSGASKRPTVVEEEPSVDPRPTKKIRRSLEGSKPTKGQGKTKAVATTANGSKSKGRKPKSATIAESNSPIVQRGPPIPRNNTGLFIVRRETPAEGIGFKKTRSGRNSIKPVNYWKGEKVEYNTDKTEDHFGGKRNFLMPTIKEVVRAEEVDQPKRARGKSKAPRSKKRVESESEDEAELDSWELEPGFINGDVRVWDPVDQTGSQAEETEVDIAFSAGAIVTTEIPGATFRFAKTLTLPFFGSGMVDLAPGGVKKRKNSRKMHMVFFVHRGRVQVTVNDTAFRIGQGGMWQVPRGNFYSIENDYDKEARIFFSQGCEILEEPEESQ